MDEQQKHRVDEQVEEQSPPPTRYSPPLDLHHDDLNPNPHSPQSIDSPQSTSSDQSSLSHVSSPAEHVVPPPAVFPAPAAAIKLEDGVPDSFPGERKTGGGGGRPRANSSVLRRGKIEGTVKRALLVFRACGFVFCLVSFSVLAADKNQGWAIDSFYRYKEFRASLYSFLRQMKDVCGAFRMHDGGEMDVRACYTAISVAKILNILDDELVQNVGDYILSCQTYEGGISGEPGTEAHGGYTFCGLATMILINEVNRLDMASLIDWLVFRQGVELGFQGRTNKLVDGCYSFWQGGAFALLPRSSLLTGEQFGLVDVERDWHTDDHQTDESSDISAAEEEEGPESPPSADNFAHEFDCKSTKGYLKMGPLFNSMALQQYLLLCSQDQEGGFKDKPGKHRDFYHTCYCLSGLSVCQHNWSGHEDSTPLPRSVLGPHGNLLEPIHPVYNVIFDKYLDAREFFSRI